MSDDESTKKKPDLIRQLSRSAPWGRVSKKNRSIVETENPKFDQSTPPGSPEKLLKGPDLSNWLDIKFNTEAGKSKLFELLRFEEGDEDDEGDVQQLLAFLNSQGLRTFTELGSVSDDSTNDYKEGFESVKKELNLTPATWTRFLILRTAIQESRKPPKPVNDINEFKASLGSVVVDWWNDVGYKLNPDDIKLADFKLPSMLADLATGKLPIKVLPDAKKTRPSLLLSNLPTNGLTEWQLALNGRTKSGCTAVFGVSGIGKTRQTFEILSNKYGHYFSAADGKEGSGVRSADFVALMSEITRVIPKLEPEGHVRLGFVADRVDIVVATRTYLLHFLLQCWKITPWQWLLIQLYPKEFLGGRDLFDELYQVVSKVRFDPMLLRTYLVNEKGRHGGKDLIIVVDEAQTLQGKLAKHFPSETRKNDGDDDDEELMIRDALSAVVKAFNGLSQGTPIHGAIFAGTGFRMSHALDTIISGVMKSREVSELETVPLPPLDLAGVKAYLSSFLDLEQVNEIVLDHICKWLIGRPRWSAAFLERFILFCDIPDLNLDTEIEFLGDGFPAIFDLNQWQQMLSESPVSATMFVAFYEYLKMNVNSDYSSRRLSDYLQTAGTVVDTFGSKYSGSTAGEAILKAFRMAVFKYACYGIPAQIRRRVNEKETLSIENLIENGLCLFVDHSKTTDFISVVQLAEPIIVETALHSFNILDLATDYYLLTKNHNDNDAQGKVLEYCCFPLLRSVFHGRDSNPLAYGWRLGRSCHGVLIANDANGVDPEGVQAYVDNTSSAMFDGQFPPLSLTDNYFGCNLLGHVYKRQANGSQVARKFLLCQVKLRKEPMDRDLLEKAFLTTTPELIWTRNRGNHKQRQVANRIEMQSNVLKKVRMSSGVGVFQVLVAMVQTPEARNTTLNGGYFSQQNAVWYKTNKALDNHHGTNDGTVDTGAHDICVDLFLENLKPYLRQEYDELKKEFSKSWAEAIYPLVISNK